LFLSAKIPGVADPLASPEAREYKFDAEVLIVLDTKKVFQDIGCQLYRTAAHAIVTREMIDSSCIVKVIDYRTRAVVWEPKSTVPPVGASSSTQGPGATRAPSKVVEVDLEEEDIDLPFPDYGGDDDIDEGREGVSCPTCESLNPLGSHCCYRCQAPIEDNKHDEDLLQIAVVKGIVEGIYIRFMESKGFRSKDGRYYDKLRDHMKAVQKAVRRGAKFSSCEERYRMDNTYRKRIHEEGRDIEFCKEVDLFAMGKHPRQNEESRWAPMGRDERSDKYAHYRTVRPPSSSGHSERRPWVPYESEVREWTARGWQDYREQDWQNEGISKGKSKGKPSNKGKG
jgi:hypothetical protein